jgi:hypothetical protein
MFAFNFDLRRYNVAGGGSELYGTEPAAGEVLRTTTLTDIEAHLTIAVMHPHTYARTLGSMTLLHLP